MPDQLFTKRRQLQRNKPFLTTRLIFSLILLSVLLAAGFYLEFGDMGDSECNGTCEDIYDISTWTIAGGIILGSIIALAATAGSLIALLKRKRQQKGFGAFLDDDPENPLS